MATARTPSAVVVLAGGERLADVGLGGPGQDRHAAGRLVGHDLDDPPPLLGRESGELAGRAVGIQPVDAAVDQPIDVAPQLRLVDLARAASSGTMLGVKMPLSFS